jgi:hypothetical protein
MGCEYVDALSSYAYLCERHFIMVVKNLSWLMGSDGFRVSVLARKEQEWGLGEE